MAIIGNKQAPSNASDQYIGSTYKGGEQWAQSFPGSSNPTYFWVTRIGANIRRTAIYDGVVDFRYALWALASGGGPGTKLAQSYLAQIPVSSTMFQVIADVESTVLMAPNVNWYAGPSFLRDESKASSPDTFRLIQKTSFGNRAYVRLGVNGPQNPFGTPFVGQNDGSTIEGSGFVVWLEGEQNVKPDAPTGVTMNGVALNTSSNDIIDTTPLIEGLFRDPNEVLTDHNNPSRIVFNVGEADKMKQFHIRIVGFFSGTIFQEYGPVNATTGQVSARKFGWTPSAIAAGAYKVQCRVSDLAGAWSDWSSHPFSIVAANVTTEGPPTGKITDTSPDTFAFTFNSTGSTSTDQVKVRIRKSNTTVRESAAIAKVVAVNTSSTVTWAQTAFTALDPGVYEYSVQARYGGVWTDWSAPHAFTINAPPNKPTGLTPNGQSFGTRPTLMCTVTDPDDSSSTLSALLDVLRVSTGTTVQHIASPFYAGNNQWHCPTNSTSVPAFDTYKWRARFTDASGAVGEWSDYATFVYAAIPAVVVTTIAPTLAGKVTAANPTLSWTVDGTTTPTSTQQAKRQVTVSSAGTGAVVHNTPLASTQSTSYQLSGLLLAPGIYNAQVRVQNSSGVDGYSPNFQFTVEFVPPATLTGVTAQPVEQMNDYSGQPSGVQVGWDPSLLPPGDFGRYEILRRIAGGEAFIGIGQESNQDTTYFIDNSPPANVPLEYSVRQVEIEGFTEIPSLDAIAATGITVPDVVITDVATGESVTLRSIHQGDMSFQQNIDSATFVTREEAPTEFRGRGSWLSTRITATLHAGDNAPDPEIAFRKLQDLSNIRHMGSGVYVVRTLCLRDGSGERLFGSIDNLSWEPRTIRGNRNVSFDFVQRAHAEGFEVLS